MLNCNYSSPNDKCSRGILSYQFKFHWLFNLFLFYFIGGGGVFGGSAGSALFVSTVTIGGWGGGGGGVDRYPPQSPMYMYYKWL